MEPAGKFPIHKELHNLHLEILLVQVVEIDDGHHVAQASAALRALTGVTHLQFIFPRRAELAGHR